MNFSKKELKKKILYRSSYRGTKEMDFLMTSFTNEYIDSLDDNDLVDLSNIYSDYRFDEIASGLQSFTEKKIKEIYR